MTDGLTITIFCVAWQGFYSILFGQDDRYQARSLIK